jgi:cytochrome c peroxidase
MGLHRWGGLPQHAPENVAARAGYVGEFLRKGLVPPPKEQRALTPDEERGKVVFESKEAACSVCHRPDTDFTDRVAYPLKALPTRKDFDDEPKQAFKTPSLLFVARRAPYFHDGSASSLERLVEQNQDRMGKTSHLSEQDRAALVAFLKTL